MINDAGVKIIKEFESLRLKSYLCPAGVWTIGWGSTRDLDGKRVVSGMEITSDEADLLLQRDIEDAEGRLKRNLHLNAINDNMYSALTSIAYNCGTLLIRREGEWVTSPLLSAVNTERWHTAAERIYNVDKNGVAQGFKATAGGKVLLGLLRRRKEERRLFETPSEKIVMLKVLSGSKN